MTINAIVAIDRNGAIGKDGAIPWHFLPDLKFFKQQTTGNAVVMGYKTWLSLGKALPNRLNIVLTRSHDIEGHENVRVIRDRESVLALAQTLDCDLFIIGGEQIYKLFLGDIERWFVTEVPLEVEGADTFIPSGFLHGFRRTETVDLGDGLTVGVYTREAAGPT